MALPLSAYSKFSCDSGPAQALASAGDNPLLKGLTQEHFYELLGAGGRGHTGTVRRLCERRQPSRQPLFHLNPAPSLRQLVVH